ncbi:iron permease [Pseudonocardia sp. K10HN5]|uniref:Iron permease n=1 Tax=Pseudonocardia acidicola TaxID=2724939 RepID=A0ABX1S3N4_9PSEU|nr:iron permease [Pseudonocardia acidicola]
MLIGLREGLEGGLVVSILLAAVHKREQRTSTTPVWLGVLAAVTLALSFGAVLTFSESSLPAQAQEILGGTLSLLAVGLVTAMIFWMRRTARHLSGELRTKVGHALEIGPQALAATAFLAVGREGLETALFLWTTVQASGSTLAPLVGAAVGLGAAIGLCRLLFRRAVRINLGTFFSRTGVALVVIAAGVLAYGLGELQNAGVLPGHSWLAFDLSARISADAWWVTLVSGVTNLAPAMTWLQVVAYLTYVGVVTTLLLHHARRPAPVPAEQPATAQPTGDEPATAPSSRPATAAPARPRHRPVRWIAVTAVVLVPLLAAAGFAMFHGSTSTTANQQVTISDSACAAGWTTTPAGPQTFTVANKSGSSGEIYLVRAGDGGILGEIEGLGPGTQRSMAVTLPVGDYAWRCAMAGQPVRLSATAHAAGAADQAAPPVVLAVSENDLQAPTAAYRGYAATQLATLAAQVATLRSDLATGQLDRARADWLPAQLTWERLGAAYGSFGDSADAIDGSPRGLPAGTRDPGFTGLRRLEFGLWHGQPAAALAPVADQLVADVDTLRQKLPTVTDDPTQLPVRAHEILEDALRDHLSGMSDQGAGAAYPETLADLEATQVVLADLAPLIDARRPGLLPAARQQMSVLQQALQATQTGSGWLSPATAPLATRQKVNAATGQLLETLSPVPDLLEVRQ